MWDKVEIVNSIHSVRTIILKTTEYLRKFIVIFAQVMEFPELNTNSKWTSIEEIKGRLD